MKRLLLLTFLALPLLGLGGCVVYDDDGGWHHHEWHEWRYR